MGDGAGDDDPVHQAPLTIGIIGVRLVHGAAVVPDHDIASTPAVAILVFLACVACAVSSSSKASLSLALEPNDVFHAVGV